MATLGRGPQVDDDSPNQLVRHPPEAQCCMASQSQIVRRPFGGQPPRMRQSTPAASPSPVPLPLGVGLALEAGLGADDGRRCFPEVAQWRP